MPRQNITTTSFRDTTLLESLDAPIIATGLDGIIVAWSRGAESLYGWTRPEALNRSATDLMRLTLPISPEEIARALCSPEARWSGQVQAVHRNGSLLTINSRRHIVTQADGTQVVVACDSNASGPTIANQSYTDLHDLRLSDLRERFQFSTDAAQIGYWFCDLPFEELIWDARVREHFGVSPGEPVDLAKFYLRLHPDDRERTRAAMAESITNHTSYDIEYRTIAPEGRERWIRAIGRTAYAADGTPFRFDGITQDVTHLRLAEEALRKSEKLALVGRLAASIAHEINNPLEAVVSLVYVARTMATDDELRGYLDQAEQELYRVAHVVTQSLRFHRQSSSAVEIRISTLIESALALYRGRLQHSKVQLTTDFLDSEPLLCLAGELRQVFANLIGNAFEATRTGRIELRARPATDPRTGAPGIRAVVADTGSGIDSATREHLFEPFITTKGELGTGLGLWVSAEILRRHKATVQVKSSTTPGASGTVFSIFFPLDGSTPTPQPPAAS
jgi:PAS domain S-box-containing protein